MGLYTTFPPPLKRHTGAPEGKLRKQPLSLHIYLPKQLKTRPQYLNTLRMGNDAKTYTRKTKTFHINKNTQKRQRLRRSRIRLYRENAARQATIMDAPSLKILAIVSLNPDNSIDTQKKDGDK